MVLTAAGPSLEPALQHPEKSALHYQVCPSLAGQEGENRGSRGKCPRSPLL